ncbi:unnamed protein product, partial [Polarella glacialis]
MAAGTAKAAGAEAKDLSSHQQQQQQQQQQQLSSSSKREVSRNSSHRGSHNTGAMTARERGKFASNIQRSSDAAAIQLSLDRFRSGLSAQEPILQDLQRLQASFRVLPELKPNSAGTEARHAALRATFKAAAAPIAAAAAAAALASFKAAAAAADGGFKPPPKTPDSAPTLSISIP